MDCTRTFEKVFRKEPDGVAFCPYRVCPLGAHIDHQYGPITGLAIDRGIHFAYSAEMSGTVDLASMNFSERVRFEVSAVPKIKQNDWADYLRGATIMLSSIYPVQIGLCGVFEGSLPIGGLSSSAAVVLSFLSALCKVNGIKPTSQEMISIAVEAENSYVGVSCGKLDQSCEIFCRKDKLLFLDTVDDSYELIEGPSNMKEYEIAVFFSGIERCLSDTTYNARVDECKAAAYALSAYSGNGGSSFEQARLRSVSRDIYEQYKMRLPEQWRRRAEHFYAESERVHRGVKAWRKGDLQEFGRLCIESGRSSIDNYGVGCPQMKTLYELICETEGVYGGRFSGAGFKGSCIALIDPQFEQSVAETVTQSFLREFPQLESGFKVNFCHSANAISFD